MEAMPGETDTPKKPAQGGKGAKPNKTTASAVTPPTAEKAEPGGKPAKGESNALPKGVTEKLHSTVRWMARSVVLNADPKRIGMALAVHELLKATHYSPEVMPKGLGKLFLPTLDRADALPVLYGLTDSQLSELCRNATAYLLEKQPGHAFNGTGASEMSKFASKVFAVTKGNPSDYFTLDREFLAPYTKAGIEAILREAVNGEGSKFVGWYESRPDKKLSGLLTKKKDEILNEIFADGGFDFKGYLPSCISKFMGDN
jgi:hypothetical protein